jgi:hypothetical protein
LVIKIKKGISKGKKIPITLTVIYLKRRKTIGELSGVYKYKIVKKAEELQRILGYILRKPIVFIG